MAAVLGPLRPDEEKLFTGQPRGFPLEDFALEDVMLPEDDDMGIASEEDSDDEEEIETESGFGSVIVVDNLPKVTEDKHDKLSNVLRKVFGQIGTVREGGLWMPVDGETETTYGFAFIEFQTPEEARAAQQQTNGYRLDKSHSFVVNMFDDFEKYSRVPEEYAIPERKAYEPQENLQQWMIDRRGRDQFAVRFGDETEIGWNDAQRSVSEKVYQRTFWTESFVQWSAHGSFLATLHMQGVAIWGGSSFARIRRFSHQAVRLMDFSPSERYLVTYSLTEPATPADKAVMNFNVFDVRSGRKLRNFTGNSDDFVVGAAGAGGLLGWPVFKWAGHPEDRYFARLAKNAISVYEAPDMGLLDRKSIKLDNVQDFEWSPAEPILCAFQTEQSNGNLPARISLIRIPDRVELRQKNLFSVSEVKLYWHPQGEYLAVQVDRYTKTRKSTYTSFELFSVRARDIPMEVLELPSKTDKIVDFAWEPKGTRFAVLHGDGSRPNLSLYEMRDMRTTARGVQLVATQPGKQVNSIYWSPQGKFLVLGGLKSMQGQLEFFSADDFEVMSAAEHFMATDIEWDPTGRYVATSVTHVHQMENGFNVWQFNGQLLYRVPRDKFFQFSWRPRAPSLLSQSQQEEILKNLKTVYSKRYEEEDAAVLQETDTQIVADRQRLLDEWQAWYVGKQEFLEHLSAGRAKLLHDEGAEGTYVITEAEVEELVGVEETVLRSNGL